MVQSIHPMMFFPSFSRLPNSGIRVWFGMVGEREGILILDQLFFLKWDIACGEFTLGGECWVSIMYGNNVRFIKQVTH
jgi:hypothetical protein